MYQVLRIQVLIEFPTSPARYGGYLVPGTLYIILIAKYFAYSTYKRYLTQKKYAY